MLPRLPKRDAEPNLIRVRPERTTAAYNMPRRIYVSAYMRNVLYTDECGRSTAGQHLIMRPRQLAYDVLNAVAGGRLEKGRWRRAQSTPKVLASTFIRRPCWRSSYIA
jgi:hypothetical protein